MGAMSKSKGYKTVRLFIRCFKIYEQNNTVKH